MATLTSAAPSFRRELRITAAALINPRGDLAPKLCFLLGLSYLIAPIDIIPDRLPYIGHLDEVSAVLLGLLGARYLSSADGAASPARRRVASVQSGSTARGLRLAVGRAGVGLFANAATRPLMRLMLGRWPTPQEVEHFNQGLRSNRTALPPLLRAIAYVPEARSLVNRTMLLAASEPMDAADAEIGLATDTAQMMGDPMRIWRGPKLSYLHLEKTAGSSLTTFLTSLFHPLQIDNDTTRVIAPDTALVARLGGHRPDPASDLVWGHYDLSTLEGVGPDRFLLTVLRDPKKRVLSLYHYFRANDGDHERRVMITHELGLLDYLRSREPDAVNMVDNLYVRRLTGLYADADGHDPLAADPEGGLARALAALEGFAFVGIAEDMDATLATLGRMLDFTPPARAPRANVSASNEANPFLPFRTIARTPITPEIEVELERATRLDRVIYEAGRRRFEALRAQA